MALILAVNPEGRQSAALERLARDLPGHELIGADTCDVAITAMRRRRPDMVILPPDRPAGQDKLLTHLRNVPGGIRILTLPPSGDTPMEISSSFAEQIRACLPLTPSR